MTLRPDRRGIGFALAAAVLFGLGTPFAKVLLAGISPVLLAGLLYAGSGIGLASFRALRRSGGGERRLASSDVRWLAGAVLAGGIVGPVLLLWGLRTSPASSASLLLNLEGVFTAALAWFVFRENFDRRIALGMLLIVAGGVVLSWPQHGGVGWTFSSVAIVGACLCWAIDNNWTQKISAADPVQVAAIKGGVAGSANIGVALALGESLPPAGSVALAMIVGLVSYGLSLCLFVLALRGIGTARTGAYFSIAPFIGAAVSIGMLGESLHVSLVVAGLLMSVGVWLHVSEHHAHEHRHDALVHSHPHSHDEHHRHEHDPGDPIGEPHTHAHAHEPIVHSHPHYPDLHHRHRHGR